MALSGAFNGTFSGTSGAYPRIEWSATQNIVDNYSDVTINLRFIKTSSWAWNNTGSANANININGDANNASITFDLRDPHTNVLVRSRTVRVYHNSDGSKTCFLGADGNTQVSWGTYNFSQTVTLDTIPREAYLTNTPNFTVENDPSLTLWNGGNQYVKADLYVNGNLVKSTNLGQVTSATFTLDGGDDAAIYALMPNVTSIAGMFRIRTYSNSGYTTQIGGNKDKAITVSINTTTNKPTFTTASFANVAKDVEVRDSYNNLLDTSNTGTLLGSSDKMIKGYSKIRATVAVADKMVALNSATPDKYRFSTASQQIEAAYSAVADVTLDLDNVTTNSFTVTAFDSRALSTAVNGSLSYLADYFNVNIFGLVLLRDNNVDAPTKLQFSGLFFNEYFGGGTSGVQNDVTIEYRFKETTVAWGAQTWTDITADADITGNNITFDEYVDGDLGVSGFDTERSFNIQVRIYDKLSAMIIEGTLSRGIPLMHFTQAGVSLGQRFDSMISAILQVLGNIFVDGDIEATGDVTADTVFSVLSHPYKFQATRTSTQSINHQTWTDIIFDSEIADPSSAYNTGTGRFVVPVSGFYALYFNCGWAGNTSDPTQYAIFDNTNSKQLAYVYVETTSIGNDVANTAYVGYLAAGSSISARVWHQAGAARNVAGGSDMRVSFGGHLLSI